MPEILRDTAPGLLLFAHGARDPNWAIPFNDVAARARRARPGMPVVLAFLEFMEPGLLDAGGQLAAEGCTHVSIVPLFLGAGGHVRRDLPALLDTLRGQHPAITWSLAPAVGELDAVIAEMAASSLRLLDDALAATPAVK